MLFFLSCFDTSVPPPPTKTSSPDVLLVVLDTVRADALMHHGNTRPVGENLATLAAQGVVYTQAWSPAPWTWPAHASLFTGLYPWEHGAHFTEPTPDAIALKPDPLYASSLDPSIPTLAEKMKEQGYDTISFSANRLISSDFDLTRGFDIAEFHNDDAKVVARARQYLQSRNTDTPLFLFINLMSAHTPWFFNAEEWVVQHKDHLIKEQAPSWMKDHLLPEGIGLHPFYPNFENSLVYRYISKKVDIPPKGKTLIRDLYEAEVRRADLQLGALLSVWNQEESIIAVTSDHGEYLGEYRLLEHGRTLYPEVLHVPLVIKAPALLPKSVDTPVPMHWLHDEILAQLGQNTQKRLSEPPTAVYAAAWPDYYWREAFGAPFDQGYRLKREKQRVVLLHEKGSCHQYVLPYPNEHLPCTDAELVELQQLFLKAKSGTMVQPSAQTLEHLKQLGYVGEEQSPKE